MTQSQVVVLQVVFHPLPWLSQTIWPPATQWLMFVLSATNGAMKRGFGSHGLGAPSTLKQDGEIVVNDWLPKVARPPLVVEYMFR